MSSDTATCALGEGSKSIPQVRTIALDAKEHSGRIILVIG